MTIQLLSIDPATSKDLAIAEFMISKRPEFVGGIWVSPQDFIAHPTRYITLRDADKRIALVEGQYVGKNMKGAVALANMAGTIYGTCLHALRFEVEIIPTWGPESWIQQHFGKSTTGEWAQKCAVAEFNEFATRKWLKVLTPPKDKGGWADMSMAWAMAQYWWRKTQGMTQP